MVPSPLSRTLRAQCVAAIALFTFTACSKPAMHDAVPAGSVVLALGDSLTFGTGATQDTSYPAVLAQLSGWKVVNAGVPGETAAQGCARLPDLVDEHRPRLVLILLGGNDFLRQLPDRGIEESLRTCIRDARSAGSEVVLLTVPRLGGNGLADAPLYTHVAKAQSVPLVDSGLSRLLAKRSLRADPIHPNAAGYSEMANQIAGSLRELGYLRR